MRLKNKWEDHLEEMLGDLAQVGYLEMEDEPSDFGEVDDATEEAWQRVARTIALEAVRRLVK